MKFWKVSFLFSNFISHSLSLYLSVYLYLFAVKQALLTHFMATGYAE